MGEDMGGEGSKYLKIPEVLDGTVLLQLLQDFHALAESAGGGVAADVEGARGEALRALHCV